MKNIYHTKKYYYSVKVSEAEDNEYSPVFRASTHPNELIENFEVNPLHSCWDIFQHGVRISSNKQFLGSIEASKQVKWLTYSDVEKQALSFGSACLAKDLVPETEFPDEMFPSAKVLRFLAIFSKNCVEWFVTEQAANAYGITLVPLYEALDDETLVHILKETKCVTVAGSIACIDKLIQLMENNEVIIKNVIIFDETTCTDSFLCKVQSRHINTFFFKEFIIFPEIRMPSPANITSISTLCYTSGTTNRPKGALLTQKNIISTLCATVRGPLSLYHNLSINSTDRHFSYLPLAHVFERIICNIAIYLGASIGIFSGDIKNILNEISIFQPTILTAVPKVLNQIHNKIFHTVKYKLPFWKQLLFWMEFKLKLLLYHNLEFSKFVYFSSFLLKEIISTMGGKLRYILVGGAVLDITINDTLKSLLSIPISEGYGLTETVGASFSSLSTNLLSGTVGGPIPSIEFCLKAIENYRNINIDGYFGELCVRGPSVFPSYFCNEVATKEAFTSEKWLCTGDIATLSKTNGSLAIVDRKKSIFKLAQGEYISPEKLETVYQSSKYVNQIFIYGKPTSEKLVAIITLDDYSAKVWATANKLELYQVYNNEAFKTQVLNDLALIAEQKKLKGFEKIKNIYCVQDPFTIENGLITPTLKLKRKAAEIYFSSQLDKMYQK